MQTTGNFTLPGEAGYEKLTLELANRWGADVIRDSDGTKLSHEILSANFGIYSTICVIREHNEWIYEHTDSRQQTFLSTPAVTADSNQAVIKILESFFNQQFAINDSPDALRYWQVYDRTTDKPLTASDWSYDSLTQEVTINAIPWHQYSVSFLAWRIWEEISMYNHVTNSWDKEHLMQLNPYNEVAQNYLREWLLLWCDENPDTTVVRFTSLFYNFAWIWGANERNRNLFVDWASYDFTVCPQALDDFAKEYGYALTAEDFVRQGKYNATHRIPNQKKLDWITFIGNFTRKATKALVDIVHAAGKSAYVFYDDSWVGLEPYNGHFGEFGFDGLIKCIFSGYEVRLCADVDVPIHEVRFHPYLFPVGLGNAPTFSKGGNPGRDARNYWLNARRALLRKKIDRCGLGGYLSLTQDFPDFIDAIDEILTEFRLIGSLHDNDVPFKFKPRVGILTAWGKLRTWTLSGHFHETDDHVLIHLLESLSGLPFEVSFISFDELATNLDNLDILINAGEAGDSWSGGHLWDDTNVIECLTAWVHGGGAFIGIGEPSAHEGRNRFLRMAHVLGVDIDYGEYACHGQWQFDITENVLIPTDLHFRPRTNVRLIDDNTKVLAANQKNPTLTAHSFGKGMGIYCTGFEHNSVSSRFLQNLILYGATGNATDGLATCSTSTCGAGTCGASTYGASTCNASTCGAGTCSITDYDTVTDNAFVECTVFSNTKKIVFANNSELSQVAYATFNEQQYTATLKAYEMLVFDL